MKTFEFNPHGRRGIQVVFDCNECGGMISDVLRLTTEIPISAMWEDEGVHCRDCDKNYPARIWQTKLGKGHGKIEDIPQDYKVDFTELPPIGGFVYTDVDYSVNKTSFKDTYEGSIWKVEQLNNVIIVNPRIRNYQKNLLFSSIITSLEAYLADSFVYLINGNEKYLNNFLTTDRNYKDRIEDNRPLKDEIMRDLNKRSFHNLKDIRRFYQKTFSIKFPEISHLLPFIYKRHDIVHRNGKTKDGNSVITNGKDIKQTIEEVNQLVQDLDRIIADL